MKRRSDSDREAEGPSSLENAILSDRLKKFARQTERDQTVKMNEDAHESIAGLASVDLGNPFERIVAREAAKRKRLCEFLSMCFGMSPSDAEIAILAFEEKEDQAYLAR